MMLEQEPDDDAGVAALARRYGDRVGLAHVLDDLNRRAARTEVPGRAVDWGFGWDGPDQVSSRWWPQGLTGSWDATASGEVAGRRVLLAGWYSRELDGETHGSRISVVDPDSLAYRHVLLVTAGESFGEPVLKPVVTHAGGLAWCGDWLHVAHTRRGLLGCRLQDVIAVEPGPDSFGHRYVLPVRRVLRAEARPGTEPFRYSFCSVDRGAGQLVAGEYGTGGAPHRLARFALDPATGELAGGAGRCEPDDLDERGLAHAQGAVVVEGTWFLTTSHGRRRPGRLHVGEPGRFHTRRGALPPGPEDLSWDHVAQRLWSLSEHPRRRFVFCMERPAPGR